MFIFAYFCTKCCPPPTFYFEENITVMFSAGFIILEYIEVKLKILKTKLIKCVVLYKAVSNTVIYLALINSFCCSQRRFTANKDLVWSLEKP